MPCRHFRYFLDVNFVLFLFYPPIAVTLVSEGAGQNHWQLYKDGRRAVMSTYKVIELVGTSYTGWEAAAKDAIEAASKTLDDLRVAEVTRMDMKMEDNRILYRTRLQVSFKVVLEKYAEAVSAKPYSIQED